MNSTNTERQTIRDIDPATGQLIAEVPCSTSSEVTAAVAQCRAAQKEWARTPIAERIRLLLAVADALVADAEAIADLVSREMGKPRAHALGEAQASRRIFEYYAEQVPSFLEPREVTSQDRRSRIVRVPIGVIGALTPWNFPVNIPLWTLAPGLMLGNGVVFKPSEIVPLTGARMHESFVKHLPEGLVGLLQGEDEVGKTLVASDVDMISFVGSRAAGKNIMAASAERLRPLALELGGKDPMLVLRDADLEQAARMAVWGSISNSGQVCCSVERIYVEEPIAEQLEQRIRDMLLAVRVGDPAAEDAQLGPMASREQRDHVRRQIDDALQKGGQLEVGGGEFHGPGYYLQPALLTHLDESMDILTEETFGPVVAVRRVKDWQEAVRLANDTRYGLGASVWTQDEKLAEEVAALLEAGTVGLNRGAGTNLLCPWGGVKESGLGRMLGTAALEEFTQTKVLHL